MADFREKIRERNLNKWHIIITTLLASLSKFGLLNQAVVNEAMKVTAKKLYLFFSEKGNLPDIYGDASLYENFKNVIAFLNGELSLSGRISVEKSGDLIKVFVKTNRCKYCPIGVGEAELEGTACPYPYLFKEFANLVLPAGQSIDIVKQDGEVLKKLGENCIIIFSQGQK